MNPLARAPPYKIGGGLLIEAWRCSLRCQRITSQAVGSAMGRRQQSRRILVPFPAPGGVLVQLASHFTSSGSLSESCPFRVHLGCGPDPELTVPQLPGLLVGEATLSMLSGPWLVRALSNPLTPVTGIVTPSHLSGSLNEPLPLPPFRVA